jgi:subfamily B ATP-binding cassette protein MsbA
MTQRTIGLQVYRRLLRYSLPYWRYLLIAVIGLTLSAASQPLFAWIMGPLLDKAILQHDPMVITWLPIGILAIFILRGGAMFLSSYYMGMVGRIITKTLRNEIFTKMLHLPIDFFEKRTSGKLLAYINYYTEQVSNATIRGATSLIQDTVTIIGLLGLMLYQNWLLTLSVFVTFPIIALIIMVVSKRLRSFSHDVQNSVGDITHIANEMVQGYKTIRVLNGSEYEAQRFDHVNEKNLQFQMKRLVIELISTPLVQFMVAIALAIIVYIATLPTTLESLSPGSFMSFIMAMILLLTPLRNLTQLNAQLQGAIAAGESIFDLLDHPAEKDTGQQQLKQCQGKVSFENVSFQYQGSEQPVLKNINFSVRSGETIAIVGRSGSGKTTLVNLLPRFYQNHTGKICIDGQPLEEIQLNSLRSNIAYVSQDIVLFNDTIRNNIAYGDKRDVDIATVKAAASAAYALEFIEALPDGFDTLIGDNGVLLSGGQRQRLSIARAILSLAPILILDEATSALDTESERHIQLALETLSQNCTTFIIAHRLSTIENADRIFVMQEGEIIESGTHQELLQLGKKYAQLHSMQFDD